MTRYGIDLLEDKRPGNIRNLADNLGVHQIAQTNETGCRPCGDSYVVQHASDAEFGFADIEPQGNDKAEGTSV